MKWEEVKKLGKEDFRRLTGLPLKVFERILEILKEEEGIKRRRGGYNHTLIMEDETVKYFV